MIKFLLIIITTVFFLSCSNDNRKYTGLFKNNNEESSFEQYLTIEHFNADTFVISNKKKNFAEPGVRRGNTITHSIGHALREFGLAENMRFYYDFNKTFDTVFFSSNKFSEKDTFIRVKE